MRSPGFVLVAKVNRGNGWPGVTVYRLGSRRTVTGDWRDGCMRRNQRDGRGPAVSDGLRATVRRGVVDTGVPLAGFR